MVFLYKIAAGGADKSYGIHVAQIAGMPPTVVLRAEEIMQLLEDSSGKAVMMDPEMPKQMSLFPSTNPLLKELASLDINELSPLEALNLLFSWKKKYLDLSRQKSESEE